MDGLHLLLVENDPVAARIYRGGLEALGYTVTWAPDPAEALRRLHQEYFDLVLIDLRLGEEDSADRSGLELAAQIDPAIPKVIMTKYDTEWQGIRDALAQQAENRHALATDFVSKNGGRDQVVRAVSQVLARAPRNGSLRIQFAEGGGSLSHLAEAIAGPLALREMPARLRELGELLRRRFAQHRQLTVRRQLLSRPGRLLLEVHAFRDDRAAEQMLLAVGHKAELLAADRAFHEARPGWLAVGDLVPGQAVETARYAAIDYKLNGGAVEHCVTLRELYGAADSESLAAASAALFGRSLKHWHSRGQPEFGPRQLHSYYRAWLAGPDGTPQPEELKRRIEAICRAALAAGVGRLSVDARSVSLLAADGRLIRAANPAGAMNIDRIIAGLPALGAMLNGSVSCDTVLVDRSDPAAPLCWAFEIGAAGPGPLPVDFVTLELALRALLPGSAGIEERLRVEQLLAEQEDLRGPTADAALSPAAQKLLRAIGELRRLAVAAGCPPSPRAYSAALFFAAVRHLLSFDPAAHYSQTDTLTYAHSLLCVALLYERLRARRPEEVAAAIAVTVEERLRLVRIGEREASLTPTEFAIFRYLYERRPRLCPYDEIARAALGDPVDGPRHRRNAEKKLHTNAQRIRKKIEPDPEAPIFLKNVRNSGYFLDLPASPPRPE